jgi:hypothetical protein
MDATRVRKALEGAKERDEIVRVYRAGLEDGWAAGFVAGIGPEFFALQIFDKACRIDGFNCLRYRDVTDWKAPEPYSDFLRKALLARGLTPASGLAVELGSLTTILETANKAFPLVAIHLEEDEGVCYIGRVQSITESEVSLLEISPDARWDSAPTLHPLSEITRVDFGGAYEEALHLVAPAN